MFEDLRAAIRLLRARPTFAASVVATLALSIGAITAVFTVADPMLFRPLPYPDADQIVGVRIAGGGIPGSFLTTSDYANLAANHRGLASVCRYEVGAGGPLEGTDESVVAYAVSEQFFDVFGIGLARGRRFEAEEFRNTSGAAVRPALITHTMWRSAFGERENIVGHLFRLGARGESTFLVVGVLPADFVFPDVVNAAPDFLMPAPPLRPDDLADVAARMKPGVSVAAARAELQAMLDTEARAQRRSARLTPIQESLLGSTKTPLCMLLLATAGLLLVACVNLTYLFSAHLEVRRAELSVRVAIGAGKWRLVRQLWMEAGVLALLAGALALPFALWLVRQIMERMPLYSHAYRLLPATVNVRVIVFATAVALIASLVYGLVPAFQTLRIDVRTALGGEAAASGARRGRSAWLIATQTMLAVTILVVGGLVMRSFVHLISQPLGFDPYRVSTVFVGSPRDAREGDATATMIARYHHLRQRFPGAVSLSSGVPGLTFATVADVAGTAKPERLYAFDVSGTFFHVFSLNLRRGRIFSDEEALSNAPVAVIDERAAQGLWPGQDPLGQQIVDGRGFTRSIVGVVDSVRMRLVPGGDVRAGTAYIPISSTVRSLGMSVSDHASLTAAALTDAVREVAPDAYVSLRPLQPFERTLGQPRFLATMLGWLSALTVVLTGIGIAGVAHHEAVRRVREIGIRLALGAEPRGVQRLMLRRSVVPSLIGITLGVAIALWWTPALESLLFGVEPHDMSTIVGIAASVLTLVLVSSWWPVRRASRVSPTAALRSN